MASEAEQHPQQRQHLEPIAVHQLSAVVHRLERSAALRPAKAVLQRPSAQFND